MAEFTDERHLVLLAQCDDREALEELFLRLQNGLTAYIRGLVGEPAAEDVLQDVFVKIWRNVKSLHMPELFRPWAYRIASRTCFEHLKRQRRRSERYDEGGGGRRPAISVRRRASRTDCRVGSVS